MTQATRSSLMSVDTTLSANIDATQDYIPVASTANFSTSVVAEVETTNEVVSFDDISENRLKNSTDFSGSNWTALTSNMTVNANSATAPDGTTTAASIVGTGSGVISQMGTVDMISVVSSKMTFSAFVKGTGFLQFYTNTFWISTGFVNINAADGTIGSSFIVSDITSTDVGNGWFRIKFSAPSSIAQTNGMMFGGSIDSNTAARAATRTNTETNFIWGWQFEDGATASTILPTGATIPLFGLTGVTRGVNGTTAASATSGDSIQQLPFAAQGLLSPVSTTLSTNITAAQDYVPLTSTNGFTDYLNATIDSNEVVSFSDISSNLFKYSEDFSNAYWTKYQASITADAGVAPDGTTTADKFIPDTTASSVHVIDASGFGNVPSGNHTLSIHVKADGYNFFHWRTDGTNSFFDLTTEAVVSAGTGVTATIEDSGNGWYRCIVTKNFGGGARASFGITETGTSRDFTGDGTKGGLLWGAQAEQASAATTYLPTTSASLSGLTNVTRGVNGTTAASATSGDTVTQTPLSTGALNMPLRLKGLSVSSDGTGAGRLTLCDKVGTHLCDVDIPDTKIFDLTFDGGIIFPNGIYVANSDNITAYTLYTSGYNSPNLTAGG